MAGNYSNSRQTNVGIDIGAIMGFINQFKERKIQKELANYAGMAAMGATLSPEQEKRVAEIAVTNPELYGRFKTQQAYQQYQKSLAPREEYVNPLPTDISSLRGELPTSGLNAPEGGLGSLFGTQASALMGTPPPAEPVDYTAKRTVQADPNQAAMDFLYKTNPEKAMQMTLLMSKEERDKMLDLIRAEALGQGLDESKYKFGKVKEDRALQEGIAASAPGQEWLSTGNIPKLPATSTALTAPSSVAGDFDVSNPELLGAKALMFKNPFEQTTEKSPEELESEFTNEFQKGQMGYDPAKLRSWNVDSMLKMGDYAGIGKFLDTEADLEFKKTKAYGEMQSKVLDMQKTQMEIVKLQNEIQRSNDSTEIMNLGRELENAKKALEIQEKQFTVANQEGEAARDKAKDYATIDKTRAQTDASRAYAQNLGNKTETLNPPSYTGKPEERQQQQKNRNAVIAFAAGASPLKIVPDKTKLLGQRSFGGAVKDAFRKGAPTLEGLKKAGTEEVRISDFPTREAAEKFFYEMGWNPQEKDIKMALDKSFPYRITQVGK